MLQSEHTNKGERFQTLCIARAHNPKTCIASD